MQKEVTRVRSEALLEGNVIAKTTTSKQLNIHISIYQQKF